MLELSPTHLLRVGLGLLGASVVVQVLFNVMFTEVGSQGLVYVYQAVAHLIEAVGLVGAGLVAGSFVVASIAAGRTDRPASQ